jgi:hypothetical protein
LFFFGSLMDLELLALVTERPAESFRAETAVLHGFERRRAVGESFPVIVPHPGGRVEGVVVEQLTESDIERIQFFEGADYALHPFAVELVGARVEAHVYLPTAQLEAEAEGWDFGAWLETERAYCFALAEEMMSYYGRLETAEIDALWPQMKARAQRRLRRRTKRRA